MMRLCLQVLSLRGCWGLRESRMMLRFGRCVNDRVIWCLVWVDVGEVIMGQSQNPQNRKSQGCPLFYIMNLPYKSAPLRHTVFNKRR